MQKIRSYLAAKALNNGCRTKPPVGFGLETVIVGMQTKLGIVLCPEMVSVMLADWVEEHNGQHHLEPKAGTQLLASPTFYDAQQKN